MTVKLRRCVAAVVMVAGGLLALASATALTWGFGTLAGTLLAVGGWHVLTAPAAFDPVRG